MPSVNVIVLLDQLVKLHNNLCEVKSKSKNQMITTLLEKECDRLFRIINTLQNVFPSEEGVLWQYPEDETFSSAS
jgi:hypothetical protein